jgi:hypothetical protein
MRVTSEWLAAYEAKRGKPKAVGADAVPAGEESILHDYALGLLRERNLPFIHSRMDRAATCTPGAPDLVFLIDGRVVLVEFKTRVGKLSQEQTVWHYLAAQQGFTVEVVRGKAEFLCLLSGVRPQHHGECQDSGRDAQGR